MRRGLRIVVLSLGVIGGFASGIASLSHRSCHRRADFEQHVAQICADAARRPPATP